MNPIINFSLKDHSLNVFVPFAAQTPMFATYPHIYSQLFDARNSNTNPAALQASTNSFTNPTSPYFAQRITTPTEYIGAATLPVLHSVNETFALFTYVAEATISSAADSIAEINLYTANDVEQKINTVFHGLQTLRIPKNRFDTVLTDQAAIDANNGSIYKPNLGKYYVRICPKYIDTTIAGVITKVDNTDAFKQALAAGATFTGTEYASLNNSYQGQRNLYLLDKEPFKGTPWAFEQTPNQRGRLYGSVVEVWNSTKTILKTTKVMAENIINPAVGGNDICALEYDAFGFDADGQKPSQGDILRIYPRETYFDPISIELDYVGAGNSVLELIRFMKNDVARNLVTGVYEIYDDKGISIDAQKNISGTVIQAYQISKEGTYEIRRGVGISNPHTVTTVPTGGTPTPGGGVGIGVDQLVSGTGTVDTLTGFGG
jgi:hypothetical protein